MKPTTRTFYELAVLRAVERIAGSPDRALDLDALAKGAALSTFHFHRVFRGLVGETPLELHRRLRLERAAEQLWRTSTGVTEIAFAAGYETHEAFTRAFRQFYGTSPSSFRQRASDEDHACHGAPSIALAARCGIHVRDGAVRLESLTLHHRGDTVLPIVVENRPALRVATVRHHGPYAEISEAFHRLGVLASEGGMYPRAQPAMLALYHDDPESTPPAELRSDAALVVDADTVLPPGITEAVIPGGRWAKTVHRGSYAGLGDAWARFMGEWLPASGHRVGPGPSYEVYVTDPRTTATEDLETELWLSLAD